MYNSKTKTITFPHLIPMNRLGGREYTWNDVDGGVKRLADFNIERNSFFGGQVTVLGMIKNLGLWACQHYESRKIIGFYVDDPNRVTERGRELLRERFADCEVVFDIQRDEPKGLTAGEKARRDALRLEVIRYGIAPELISHTNANELAGMLEALKSGKAEKSLGAEQAAVVSTLAAQPEPTVPEPVAKPLKPRRSMEA